MQKLKKLFYSALTLTFLFNTNIPVNSTEKEVKVYSGRHYNTDRGVYKKFAEETGIKVRLIEAAGISLIERLKREGKNSQADLILLVDAARITNAAKADLLQSIESSSLEKDVPVGLKDPDKKWYALTRRVRVMVANPKVVDINKINDLKFLIRKKIDNYQENSMMATNLSDLITYTEEIYKEYIGIIRPRVVVSGKKEYLERNSSLIRALLLSGIRAAFLWDYHGGSKWHLMFRRKEILNKCENYFI